MISVSVCLYVSPRAHFHSTIFTKFLCMLPMAVAWSSPGGVATCCVLPVLWMKSFFSQSTIWRHVDIVAVSDVIESSCSG